MARFGVLREKYNVVSLRIWEECGGDYVYGSESPTHLEQLAQLIRHVPLPFRQLQVMQIVLAVGHHCVDRRSILDRKVQHIESGVPACLDILWHYPFGQLQFLDDVLPCRRKDGGLMDKFEGQFSKLSVFD